jgi:hypothetical protein
MASPGNGGLMIGGIAGFGHSQVTNLDGSTSFKPSWFIGVNILHEVRSHFTFGNSFIFSAEGYKTTNEGSEVSVTPLYLRLPFRATYYLGDSRVQPIVYLGPVFGYKISEWSSTNRVVDDMFLGEKSNKFNRLDFGLNGGLGLNIKLVSGNYLTFDAGYYQGLLDVIDDAATSISNKNQTLTFNVGLLFAIRGNE